MRYLLILLSLLSSFSFAQDYLSDMKKILDDFANLEEYRIASTVSVKGEESFSFTASIAASKKFGSFVQIDGSDMLINPNYAISVDHSEKLIRIDNGDFKTKSGSGDNYGLEMIDDMLESSNNISYLGVNEGNKVYKITGQPNVEKTIVKISVRTGFFSEIEVFYDSDDISISSYKIRYTEFNKTPHFTKDDFSESKLVQKGLNGEWIAVSKYPNYIVID